MKKKLINSELQITSIFILFKVPPKRDSEITFISNEKGHLNPGVRRSETNPFGDYVGTWDLPKVYKIYKNVIACSICLSLILLNSILIKFKSIAGPYQLNKVNCVLKIIISSFQKDINFKNFTQNRIFLRLDVQTKMLKSFIPKKETLKIRLKLHKKIM